MRCTDPRTVGFLPDGKTISWSQKTYSREYAIFQLPCGQCIECRLEYARQWAVRCVHEAQMYEKNCFITLTYDDEHLESDRLIYAHFQNFLKRLRDFVFRSHLKSLDLTRDQYQCLEKNERKSIYAQIEIGCFVTGEYGDKRKRPHWHACLFNWSPGDAQYKYSNERGDQVFSSEILSSLWGFGIVEFGSLTFESAGYCARYAAKKLVHGADCDHDFVPISKKSSRQAIGKKFLEKFWRDIFSYGELRLPNGATCAIPRYYERWLKKNQPDWWIRYVTETKQRKISMFSEKEVQRLLLEKDVNFARANAYGVYYVPQITRNESRRQIQEQKFKQLQEKLKL